MDCDKAMKLHQSPKYVAPSFIKCLIYIQMGKYDLAISEAKKIVLINDDPSFSIICVYSFYCENKYSEGIECFNRTFPKFDPKTRK